MGGSFSARHVQEACLNGWPALREVVFDGWLARFADGYTRRSNSVNLLSPGTRDPDEKLRACERLYAAQGLPTIVCLPSMAGLSMGHALDGRGYGPPEDETRVLSMAFEPTARFWTEGVELEEGLPGEAWLGALARLQGQGESARQAHRKILEALAVPAVFASVPAGRGRSGALGFGAVHDGLVCVNSVVTEPEFRRRGLAGRAISGILHWAQSRQGATGACVPVVASNGPAVALYESLGFRHEVFRYHYRRRSGGV